MRTRRANSLIAFPTVSIMVMTSTGLPVSFTTWKRENPVVIFMKPFGLGQIGDDPMMADGSAWRRIEQHEGLHAPQHDAMKRCRCFAIYSDCIT